MEEALDERAHHDQAHDHGQGLKRTARQQAKGIGFEKAVGREGAVFGVDSLVHGLNAILERGALGIARRGLLVGFEAGDFIAKVGDFLFDPTDFAMHVLAGRLVLKHDLDHRIEGADIAAPKDRDQKRANDCRGDRCAMPERQLQHPAKVVHP